jgi:tRNA-dihydrouridine synthase B
MAPPLEDNSDEAFREICFNHGADVTFTEMTRLKGLLRNNKSTLQKIEIKSNTPTIIQLLASNENDLKKFLDNFVPQNGFKGFNLNLGCPSPDVVSIGLGCAFMKRIAKTQKLIDVFRTYNYPISLKLRLGMNNFEKQRKTYINLIKETNPDFFILHARHGKQTYDEPADFTIYEEVAKLGKTIIANGDIHTKEQIDYLKKIGINGVMIGRFSVYNPGIFNELKNNEKTPIDEIKKEYLDLAKKYDTSQKYIENVTKRMGRNQFTKKEDLNSVQG